MGGWCPNKKIIYTKRGYNTGSIDYECGSEQTEQHILDKYNRHEKKKKNKYYLQILMKVLINVYFLHLSMSVVH